MIFSINRSRIFQGTWKTPSDSTPGDMVLTSRGVVMTSTVVVMTSEHGMTYFGVIMSARSLRHTQIVRFLVRWTLANAMLLHVYNNTNSVVHRPVLINWL